MRATYRFVNAAGDETYLRTLVEEKVARIVDVTLFPGGPGEEDELRFTLEIEEVTP